MEFVVKKINFRAFKNGIKCKNDRDKIITSDWCWRYLILRIYYLYRV